MIVCKQQLLCVAIRSTVTVDITTETAHPNRGCLRVTEIYLVVVCDAVIKTKCVAGFVLLHESVNNVITNQTSAVQKVIIGGWWHESQNLRRNRINKCSRNDIQCIVWN